MANRMLGESRKSKLTKKKMVWAINETISMRQASQLCGVAYNTFKKYAKMYDIWAPLPSSKGVPQKRGRYGAGKPLELQKIFAGESPTYSTAKLFDRCVREGYLAEECSNCGYDEYRHSDMSKPLILDYMDDDDTNKSLDNLRPLCFNCFFIMKGRRLKVKTPKNIKQFQRAVGNLFSQPQTSQTSQTSSPLESNK